MSDEVVKRVRGLADTARLMEMKVFARRVDSIAEEVEEMSRNLRAAERELAAISEICSQGEYSDDEGRARAFWEIYKVVFPGE